MLSNEKAQEWISEAEADARLSPIMKEVEDRYHLGVRIRDEPEWSSTVDGDKAEIGMADTQRHLQAFAHELLHLRLSQEDIDIFSGQGT